MITKKVINILFLLWYLLPANTTFAYTHADTLRGSNGRGRDWWDVKRYDLEVTFDTANKAIFGTNGIFFSVTGTPHDSLQLDLQRPMEIDSVILMASETSPGNKRLPFVREDNVWWVTCPFHRMMMKDSLYSLMVYFHGAPRAAVNPPWDGGFSWQHDNENRQWVAVSCQGLGASVWWPCKDAQWDKPDDGVSTRFLVPGYYAIGNGRPLFVDSSEMTGKKPPYSGWVVRNPINTYDVTFYIGDYVHWHDTIMGEKGVLDLDFYVLRDNEQKAKEEFAVVKDMLHCYEYWLGPYPFYEDGYKLAEAPYVGMEHQSAIAYGNKYELGYLGRDRSGTGIGMKFDYIIVHESGHEWFGNNITARDIADNWIHEGLTTYSESLFAEYMYGKEDGQRYCRGEWHNILNDKPIIGNYGVNKEGSGDMYDKGAAIMYMIREMTGDDQKFRAMLRGLNKDFYHSTVTTKQVEQYIEEHTGLSLQHFFDQYLRTAKVPKLEYAIKDDMLSYRFSNIVPGFTLPISVSAADTSLTITPTAEWQSIKWDGGYNIEFSKDFLIDVKQ